MYRYKAKLVRVVDGDTAYLEVDVGFYMKATISFRLTGIDAPELREVGGPAAKTYLLTLLEGQPLVIDTQKADSFGRWLCTIYISSPLTELVSVNDAMVKAGHAVPYRVSGA